MGTGKAVSQGAHAALGTFTTADESRRTAYHADGLGTKICLSVGSLEKLLKYYRKAQELNLPHFLVEDTGRNTTFGGVPTISALGVGPLWPRERAFLKRLPLHP